MFRIPITMLLMYAGLVSPADAQTTSVPDSATVFPRVEIDASFPGGEPEWRKFLEKNMNPDVPVENGAPNGRYLIVVQFVVSKDGYTSDVRALTNEGYGMEAEVVRVLKKSGGWRSGGWKPATQDDKPVYAYRKQSVTFTVSQDGFYIRSKTPYVLFTNTDNELVLEISKAKIEKINATISDGTIIHNANGSFTARVSRPGRVLVTVFNKKKKRRPIGAMSFEVKTTEQPRAQ